MDVIHKNTNSSISTKPAEIIVVGCFLFIKLILLAACFHFLEKVEPFNVQAQVARNLTAHYQYP